MRLAHATPLLALLAAACSSGVTPPGPFYALEGASTVGGSSTRFDLAVGGGGGGCCGWPGGAGGGGLRLRHGVGDDVELGVSSLWLGHDYTGFTRPRGKRFRMGALSGQLELKWVAMPGVAFVAGVGGGVTPVGAFVSPQLAVVFGRTGEHRIEPYGQARIALSQPVGPRGVLEDEDPGTVEAATYLLGAGGLLIHFDETFALGIETGAGFIVPRGDGEMGGAGYAAVSLSLTL